MQGFGLRRRGAGRSRNGALGAPTIWPPFEPNAHAHLTPNLRFYVTSQLSDWVLHFIQAKPRRVASHDRAIEERVTGFAFGKENHATSECARAWPVLHGVVCW